MKLLKTLRRFLKDLSIGLGIFFHILALHTVGKNLTPGAFALHLRKKIKRVGITVQHQGTQIKFAIGVFAVIPLLPTSVLTHDLLPASDAGSDVCSLVVFVVSVIFDASDP